MKKKIALPALVLGLVVLGGCASNPTFPVAKSDPAQQGDVVIYRESAFAVGGVTLTVGADGKAFANLENGEKVAVRLHAGDHDLFVQARDAKPTQLKVSLLTGTALCLRTSANANTFAKSLIPFALMTQGYQFDLEQVPCPSAEEMGKYKEVKVTYE